MLTACRKIPQLIAAITIKSPQCGHFTTKVPSLDAVSSIGMGDSGEINSARESSSICERNSVGERRFDDGCWLSIRTQSSLEGFMITNDSLVCWNIQI